MPGLGADVREIKSIHQSDAEMYGRIRHAPGKPVRRIV
jgi:hypothetical protein